MEGGYWLGPLEARAIVGTQEAARLLVEAHLAAEEAEGAARAIGLALRGEEWRSLRCAGGSRCAVWV